MPATRRARLAALAAAVSAVLAVGMAGTAVAAPTWTAGFHYRTTPRRS